jgi:H+/Cl- antiporter ClcA
MKRILVSIILSAFVSILISQLYVSFYYGKLIQDFSIADFSEAVSFSTIAIYNLIFTMFFILTTFILQRLTKNQRLTDFISNVLFLMISVALVFVVLKMDDPKFKNEDTQLFIDYFKGFVMPLIFFPVLSYFTIKPLFGKN